MQAVSELQQQVADLKLEKEQLLKAVTEQQHDAACLAEHVAQIGQLKHVLANLQQHNTELETITKASIDTVFPQGGCCMQRTNASHDCV